MIFVASSEVTSYIYAQIPAIYIQNNTNGNVGVYG